MRRCALLSPPLPLALALGLALAGCSRRAPPSPAAQPVVVPSPLPGGYGQHEPTDGARLEPVSIFDHRARVDGSGRLLSWVEGGSPYDEVSSLAMAGLLRVPLLPNGKKTYFVSSMFSAEPGRELGLDRDWVHHPAGLGAMLVDSALAFAAYGGQGAALEAVLPFADHILLHGRTGPEDAWASVPYACSSFGELTYRGADEARYCPGGLRCGIGDGLGVVEPDKVGEMGHAWARLYEATGRREYLEAALACGNSLVRHARRGDAARSPWPFRVDARTGLDVREAYSANVLGPVKLFDELIAVGEGDVAAYARAREAALAWLLAYPVETGNWDGYFEDIAHSRAPGENPNQYTPLEVARYLMLHPEIDPRWREHAEGLLRRVTELFTVDVQQNVFEPGHQLGAEIVSEQRADMAKMASHTARFASVLALYHEKTGEPSARERAFRSFNWASYACSTSGIVAVSPNPREGFWFSDGYGDYVRHFLAGMASVPAWAPATEPRVLRSSTVLRDVRLGPSSVRYRAFAPRGAETLRLPGPVARVTLDHASLGTGEGPGSRYEVIPMASGGVALRLFREGGREVEIELLSAR